MDTLIKINGKTKKFKFSDNFDNMVMYSFLRVEDLNEEETNKIASIATGFIKNISKNFPDKIGNAYKKLLNIESLNETTEIFSNLSKTRINDFNYKDYKNKLMDLVEIYPMNTINELCKACISEYFKILKANNRSDENYILNSIIDNNNTAELINNYEKEFDYKNKNNINKNIYTYSEYQFIKNLLIQEEHNLCWDCAANTCCSCPKIIDMDKKEINKYKFIETGKQIYNYNNEKEQTELEAFYITDCKRFVKRKDIKK